MTTPTADPAAAAPVVPVADLDASQTLAALEAGVRTRRAAEVADLELCLHWADLHATDPRQDPDHPSHRGIAGGDRLVGLGGEGTPPVRELTLCELGIARGVHTNTARSVLADALDLRHRLPLTWSRVTGLHAEVWVARKIATTTRHLGLDAVGLVDAAVSVVIGAESPARVLDLTAAKTIEADQAVHDARLEAERRRRFVSLTRSEDTGLRTVIARVTTGDAHWVDATLDRVADILLTRSAGGAGPEGAGELTRDEARAQAFGYLARPAELLQLLLQHTDTTDTTEDTDPDPEPSRATAFPADLLGALRHLDLTALKPDTVLYVHLHEAALLGVVPGVARAETLGPHTIAALTELLAHAAITVKPVIDNRQVLSTRSYEYPEALRERIHLLRPGDRFPHATTVTRRLDIDHPVSYDPAGPPDQTSTHTGQPLARTTHRAKTHLGYRCTPLPTGEVLWQTPHGLARLVDNTGTHTLTPHQADGWASEHPIDRLITRILHQHHTGQTESLERTQADPRGAYGSST